MFKKILIANRGDNGRQAVAVKAHVGWAGVMLEPDCRVSEANDDQATGAERV